MHKASTFQNLRNRIASDTILSNYPLSTMNSHTNHSQVPFSKVISGQKKLESELKTAVVSPIISLSEFHF